MATRRAEFEQLITVKTSSKVCHPLNPQKKLVLGERGSLKPKKN